MLPAFALVVCRSLRRGRGTNAGAKVFCFFFLVHHAQATPRADAAARLAETERRHKIETRAQDTARRDLASAQSQAARLTGARATQAAALQQTEARQRAAKVRLTDAGASGRAAEAALANTEHDLSLLLPVMLRVSRGPEVAVLAAPVPPAQAILGLQIIGTLANSLNSEAARLRAQQDEAARARAAIATEVDALARAQAGQAARAATLDRVVAQARDQVDAAEAEGSGAALQVAAAAAQARTLRGAIAAMDEAQARALAHATEEADAASRQHKEPAAQAARARQAALSRPPGPALAQSAGTLVQPVAGAVLRAFGAAAEDGPATGITYAAAPGAAVNSPCNGRVAFAAPFRSYGQLLILECGGGYDIVLAGLGIIATRPGHPARAGEPVGRMPEAGKPQLYVELRSQSRPVDPAPFLRAKL